jgi:predicted nucleic acid-binding Zn ribbon protein
MVLVIVRQSYTNIGVNKEKKRQRKRVMQLIGVLQSSVRLFLKLKYGQDHKRRIP